MSNIVCPECGKEQAAEMKVCPECGFSLETDNKNQFCKECGEALSNGKTLCSNCGFDNVSSEQIKMNVEKSKNKLVGIVLIAVACIMFVISFTRINNDKNDFYKQHYEECMDGYDENIYMSKISGGWFSSSYKSIANSYKDMADDDMAEINKYRVQAALFAGVGGGLVFFGCKYLKKRRLKNGIN